MPKIRYAKFGQWMGELADQKHRAQLIEQLLPALDKGAVVASLRCESGSAALDVGCGEGTVACLLAAAFPTSRIVGVDASAAAVAAARVKAAQAGLANVEFFVADVSSPG